MNSFSRIGRFLPVLFPLLLSQCLDGLTVADPGTAEPDHDRWKYTDNTSKYSWDGVDNPEDAPSEEELSEAEAPMPYGMTSAEYEVYLNELNCGTNGARSPCITTKSMPGFYYADQSEKYFGTLDSSVSITIIPNYSDLVARYEWEPWLLLTGYGRWNMIWTDVVQKLFPTSYAEMDCRSFDEQPFGRCHVVFDYNGRHCPIYEEFTFNEQGEITFIEAWTDHPQYLPMDPETDYWAEGPDVDRVSTRIPGLGKSDGRIEPYSFWMDAAAGMDPDVRDFQKRVKYPYYYWFKELAGHIGKNILDGCDPSGDH